MKKTPPRYSPTGIFEEDVTFFFCAPAFWIPKEQVTAFLSVALSWHVFSRIIRGDHCERPSWIVRFWFFLFAFSKRKCPVCSMASVSRLARRKDATRWPRMSSTFWAVVLLTALLVLYCGKWRRSSFDHTNRHLGALNAGACAQWVTVSCGDDWATKWSHRSPSAHRSHLLSTSHFLLLVNGYWNIRTHTHSLNRFLPALSRKKDIRELAITQGERLIR